MNSIEQMIEQVSEFFDTADETELVDGVLRLLTECADRIYGVGEDETVMREPVRNAVAKIDEARAACRSVLEALN